MFINFAHRGASTYAPENTMASFCKGIEMGANGIETDVQRTKDGVLVLHHDDTIFRTVGIDRRVSDLTLRELKELDFGSFFSSKYLNERIVTLEDFLYYFSGKPLHFAIEIKQDGIEEETLALCDRYLPRDKFTITSFLLDSILKLADIESPPNLGLLATSFDKAEIETLLVHKIGQYCPFAPDLNKEQMQYLRDKGFNIRAWGIADENVMQYALAMGVDGMTVNFPDKLTAAMNG